MSYYTLKSNFILHINVTCDVQISYYTLNTHFIWHVDFIIYMTCKFHITYDIRILYYMYISYHMWHVNLHVIYDMKSILHVHFVLYVILYYMYISCYMWHVNFHITYYIYISYHILHTYILLSRLSTHYIRWHSFFFLEAYVPLISESLQ